MESQLTTHLAAFRTMVLVAETGSFTEAARRLALTPSGVSKQLGRLEQALGLRLFERTTRKVRPTQAGLELCQRVRPLFESLEDAARAVREQGERIEGVLRISASPALGRAVLLPVLRALAANHPALRFSVTLTGRRLDFIEDGIDLAVREGPLVDSTLIARLLGTARVGMYAAPDYLARRGRPRSLAEVARHDVITIPIGAGTGVHPQVRKLGLVPRFEVDDLHAVAALAEDGCGIAPLPDYLADARVASGNLERVLPRVDVARFPIHAVYPSRRHLPRRVQTLIAAMTEAMK
jgi:DNA-binding transcriptional LysR family regulator